MKDRIESVMAKKGISKRELANRLGILPQNVNVTIATENLSKLKQIANALECDISEFLTNDTMTGQHNVNGFVEYNGEIYRIRNSHDLRKLLEIME